MKESMRHRGGLVLLDVGNFPTSEDKMKPMGAMTDVGDRIRDRMPRGMSQRQLAERIGLAPDALSRALNGQRGLSPIEVAKIAQILGVDTHWLITGTPDPLAVAVAARHAWDASRRERHNPGKHDDQPLLDQVIDLYRAAYPQGPSSSAELPSSPLAMGEILGDDFVRGFADNVERTLSVDVIRIPGLGTDYSLRIGNRGVIVLATQASWFRSNWSLAHELGHLALGHHSTHERHQRIQRDERAADAFAAELLISRQDLDKVVAISSDAALARIVWDLGVSTEALRNRLNNARKQPNNLVADALQLTTPRLLRANAQVFNNLGDRIDQIAFREQVASARRFPLSLLSELRGQTEIGAASPVHLSWALDVPVDDIDFPEPDEHTGGYERMLADRPSADYWQSVIAGSAQLP